jgi:short-subunit dehydrogenase
MATKKIILITGASSGIGKATALQLIKEGHTVYGAARRVEKMQELVEAGGHAIAMDITDEAQVKTGVQKVMDEQGRIDVLVNNAGYGLYGAVEDIPLEDARRQFEVNIFGLASITKEVLPHMRQQKSGQIINMSSMGGKMYTPLGAWYHATKHALEGWSDALRLELKAFNIDVVIIEPGVIATEFGDVMYEPMLEYSGNGAYADLANALAKATKATYEPSSASPPSVISDAISQAIKSDNPKTRYRVGKFAKPMVWIRNFLGDRIFDRAVMSQVK